jgi:translation initiation factor 1
MAQNNSNNKNSIVWSDDPKDKCPKCGSVFSVCKCKPEEAPHREYKFVAVFRLEKNGRGGKTVTVIDQLPKNEIFLKDLIKELKSKCGTGGTYLTDGKVGALEIQGDKRVQIKALFDKKGLKYKGM